MTQALLILRQVPPPVRLALLLLWIAAAIVFWLLYIFGVDLDYSNVRDGMLVAAGYLTLQSASNVHPIED